MNELADPGVLTSYAARRAAVHNEVMRLKLSRHGENGSLAEWTRFVFACEMAALGFDSDHWDGRATWRSTYTGSAAYKVDIAALWAEFPAGYWNGSAALHEALYEGSGLAKTVARAMRCRKRSTLVGMYDALLRVDSKHEGMAALLVATSGAQNPVSGEREHLARVTLTHLRCIVGLIERYADDYYALSTLASFTQKEASFGIKISENVGARYAKVENSLLALRRGITAG